MGWEEWHSAAAAYSSSFASYSASFDSSTGPWCTAVTSKLPLVMVPVLSNATVETSDSVSR